MTTTRKLTIAAVLLVCGAIVSLVVRRPAPTLTISLSGYETDAWGRVTAKIWVTNTTSTHVGVIFGWESKENPGIVRDGFGSDSLRGNQAGVWTVIVPQSTPWRVVATCIDP